MRHSIAVAVIAVLITTGCGRQQPGDPGAASDEGARRDSQPQARTEPKLELPPPVVVTDADTRLELSAFTTCWASACMDGVPPDPLPDLGVVDAPITVTFPLADFELQASMEPLGDRCPETLPAQMTAAGDGTWTLHPAGPPGRYQVTVSGNGAGGDVHVAFAMTSQVSGPLPDPTALADIFWDNSGVPRSEGDFDVYLLHLSATPRTAALALTVTADDGQVSTYSLRRRDARCEAPGSVIFDSDAPRDVVAAIGPPPYRLRFDLQLDGRTYAADVAWPEGMEPETFSIPLEFDPALPSR